MPGAGSSKGGWSRSCGVWHTLDVGQALEVIAACPAALADASRFNAALMCSARTAGEGMFIRALRMTWPPNSAQRRFS